jgi:trk system potassium uptake protein TrkH
MHVSIIAKILGSLLMVFSLLSNLPPLFVSLIFDDGMAFAFIYSLLIIFVVGLLLYLPAARTHTELSTKDGFLVVTLFWVVLGTAGSLPFVV